MPCPGLPVPEPRELGVEDVIRLVHQDHGAFLPVRQ